MKAGFATSTRARSSLRKHPHAIPTAGANWKRFCLHSLDGQVGFDSSENTRQIFICQARDKVFPSTPAGLFVEFIQAVKANRIEHVALGPELEVTIGRKRIGSQDVVPILLNLWGSGGNGDHGAELADMRRCWRDHYDLAHLHHLGSNKAPREVAQQNVALLGMVVERQSLDPIKARPPEGGLNRHAAELASPFCAAGSTPKGNQTPAGFRR